jgi:predicted regulator of amino acid metabolism with ACT domain
MTRNPQKKISVNDIQYDALLKIAGQYGCTRCKGGEDSPDIGELVRQIADGRRLQVISAAPPLEDGLILDIVVLSNLNGTLSEIAKKISQSGCDIRNASAGIGPEGERTLRIEIQSPDLNRLPELAKSLYQITVGDLMTYNDQSEDKLRALLKTICTLGFSDAKFKGANSTFVILQTENNTQTFFQGMKQNLDLYKNIKVVRTVVVSIALRFGATNQKGTLWQVTQKIAAAQISITDLRIRFHSNNKNMLDLLLNIPVPSNEIPVPSKAEEINGEEIDPDEGRANRLAKIGELITSLNDFEFVDSVVQINPASFQ